MEVKVTLRNPLDHSDLLDYYIIPDDHQLARDWITALQEILDNDLRIQQEYCFLGFPDTHRTLDVLCNKLNDSIKIINEYDFTQHGLDSYIIEDWFHPDVVRFPDTYPIDEWSLGEQQSHSGVEKLGLRLKHEPMNRLHNHFELLEGTVENPSRYGQVSPPTVRRAIGDLNHLCHEIESLVLSQRKARVKPEWIRPSQITTFDNRKRYELTEEHRQGFQENKYDREFGHVYMHWTQIGKTLIEVFRDENAPDLNETICEAITHLRYYSGEFDVEWGQDVTRDNKWHADEQILFENWLLKHGYDPHDLRLSLGHLHIGKVDLERSFGTNDMFDIWKMLGKHLEIFSIAILDQ